MFPLKGSLEMHLKFETKILVMLVGHDNTNPS